MPNNLPRDIPLNFVLSHTYCILRSYKKWTGKDLIPYYPDPETSVLRVFYAPFVLVTSNNAADPILNYGNEQGLALWEMTWAALTQTPGRHTAEPMHRDERQKFLDEVQKNGFIENYSGIRISSSGKRFKIENATVWNLIDTNGNFAGQAAKFDSWKYL